MDGLQPCRSSQKLVQMYSAIMRLQKSEKMRLNRICIFRVNYLIFCLKKKYKKNATDFRLEINRTPKIANTFYFLFFIGSCPFTDDMLFTITYVFF